MVATIHTDIRPDADDLRPVDMIGGPMLPDGIPGLMPPVEWIDSDTDDDYISVSLIDDSSLPSDEPAPDAERPVLLSPVDGFTRLAMPTWTIMVGDLAGASQVLHRFLTADADGIAVVGYTDRRAGQLTFCVFAILRSGPAIISVFDFTTTGEELHEINHCRWTRVLGIPRYATHAHRAHPFAGLEWRLRTARVVDNMIHDITGAELFNSLSMVDPFVIQLMDDWPTFLAIGAEQSRGLPIPWLARADSANRSQNPPDSMSDYPIREMPRLGDSHTEIPSDLSGDLSSDYTDMEISAPDSPRSESPVF